MNAKKMIAANLSRMAGQLRSMADAVEQVPPLLERISFIEEPNNPAFNRPEHPNSLKRFVAELREVLSARPIWETPQIESAIADLLMMGRFDYGPVINRVRVEEIKI